MVTEPVGLVGVGAIGLPIAKNLIAAGRHVLGFRRSSLAALVAAGGEAARSPAAIAARATAIITCLPDAAALAEVTGGPDGLARALRPGTVVIEASTLPLAAKAAAAKTIADAGGVMLDCPIGATPPMVAERKGIVFASGDRAAFERVLPVFEAFIDATVHVGPFGAGLTMKLVSNLLVAVNNAAAAEAMALADRAGLDREQVVRLVAASSGSSRQWEARAPQMAARRYAPAVGAVATLEAVLEVIDDTARALGVATPLYDLARASYARALAEGRGADDIACLFEAARAATTRKT